jgi:hypothetical protein
VAAGVSAGLALPLSLSLSIFLEVMSGAFLFFLRRHSTKEQGMIYFDHGIPGAAVGRSQRIQNPESRIQNPESRIEKTEDGRLVSQRLLGIASGQARSTVRSAESAAFISPAREGRVQERRHLHKALKARH